MNATYYEMDNGSAAIENPIVVAPVMTCAYHLYGTDLRITHYCGSQNRKCL